MSTAPTSTGYLHPGYACSLAEFGTPRELPESCGWILERPIPGTEYCDAMGCYPLFACQNWRELGADLDSLGTQYISLSMVLDPFGDFKLTHLNEVFDIVRPYKEHLIVNLRSPSISAHHRYYAKRSLRKVDVEVCSSPAEFADEWIALYSHLIARHNLRGIHAFSPASFLQQLRVPGMVAFKATHNGTVVAGQLWYLHKGVGYSHLTAANQLGYNLRASYALYYTAIEWFAERIDWLDLGAGAGLKTNGDDGLTEFKKGWANDTRPAYFCGRVFNRRKYLALTEDVDFNLEGYFPAYRRGEFGSLQSPAAFTRNRSATEMSFVSLGG
jgi:hypothetical protein